MRTLIVGGGVIGTSVAINSQPEALMSLSSSGVQSPALRRASRAGSWQWIGATEHLSCTLPAEASPCMQNWRRGGSANGVTAG